MPVKSHVVKMTSVTVTARVRVTHRQQGDTYQTKVEVLSAMPVVLGTEKSITSFSIISTIISKTGQSHTCCRMFQCYNTDAVEGEKFVYLPRDVTLGISLDDGRHLLDK